MYLFNFIYLLTLYVYLHLESLSPKLESALIFECRQSNLHFDYI
jgi:hypothetical protein